MISEEDCSALLVIDIQEGCFFIPGVSIHEPNEFLSCVSHLISRARSTGVQVIYTQQIGPPGHSFELGSEEGRIHSVVAPLDSELVIQKKESDAFLGTALHAKLQKLGITTLVVCGMLSEYCVDTTCRSAYGLGYDVHLVQDAHTTGSAGSLSAKQIIEHHNQTLGGTYVVLSSTADALP